MTPVPSSFLITAFSKGFPWRMLQLDLDALARLIVAGGAFCPLSPEQSLDLLGQLRNRWLVEYGL
jgi:hypothetical protein